MTRTDLYARLERAIVDGASLSDALDAVDAIRDGVPVADAVAAITPTVRVVTFGRVTVAAWMTDAADDVPGF